MKIHLLVGLVILAQTASASFSQTPSPSPASSQSRPATQKPDDIDVVRITTNLVQVDVVVTDKSGKVVTDLKPEEIEIFEDGQKQRITNFSYNASAASSADLGTRQKSADNRADKNLRRRHQPV